MANEIVADSFDVWISASIVEDYTNRGVFLDVVETYGKKLRGSSGYMLKCVPRAIGLAMYEDAGRELQFSSGPKRRGIRIAISAFNQRLLAALNMDEETRKGLYPWAEEYNDACPYVAALFMCLGIPAPKPQLLRGD